jgi:hypothetical protein
MGRPVKARKSYARDAIAINCIMEAIQIDPRASEEWKRQTIALLRAAMTALLEHHDGN